MLIFEASEVMTHVPRPKTIVIADQRYRKLGSYTVRDEAAFVGADLRADPNLGAAVLTIWGNLRCLGSLTTRFAIRDRKITPLGDPVYAFLPPSESGEVPERGGEGGEVCPFLNSPKTKSDEKGEIKLP